MNGEANGEQQTANGSMADEDMENGNEEPILSDDCYFKDDGECQWADCPCDYHAGD